MSLRIYIGLITIVLFTIPYGCGQIENGGPIVSLENYGHQAVVQLIVKNAPAKYCGGSLVSQFHVLTTASCFSTLDDDFYDIQVRVGSVDILTGGDVYNVSRVERHPQYDAYVSSHNIAIVYITNGIQFVKLTEITEGKLNYLKTVKDIPLSSNFVPGGDQVTVAGYSVQALKSPFNSLQNMYTKSMSFFPCLDFFHNNELASDLIVDEILCVKNIKFSGFCDFLDGTPVVMDGKLVGIFSGVTCKNDNTPLLFTRIERNLLWLQSKIHGSRFKNTGAQCFDE